ncbi:hypothetical protein N665_0064s0085 [Sinapis alba]|nr:hypothetical protein N665_0064s0085 [Sinapis alba]
MPFDRRMLRRESDLTRKLSTPARRGRSLGRDLWRRVWRCRRRGLDRSLGRRRGGRTAGGGRRGGADGGGDETGDGGDVEDVDGEVEVRERGGDGGAGGYEVENDVFRARRVLEDGEDGGD